MVWALMVGQDCRVSESVMWDLSSLVSNPLDKLTCFFKPQSFILNIEDLLVCFAECEFGSFRNTNTMAQLITLI